MPPFSLLGLSFGLLILIIASFLWWQRRKRDRRRLALTRLLDRADAVEDLLNRSQARMATLQSLVSRVPADIGATAQKSLAQRLPIREAKRDVLQHRLWIQQHGALATPAELDAACTALDRVLERLSHELGELEKAGAEFADATQAATDAAQREPAALRRDPKT